MKKIINNYELLKPLYPNKRYTTDELADKCGYGKEYVQEVKERLIKLRDQDYMVYYEQGTWGLNDIGRKYCEANFKL